MAAFEVTPDDLHGLAGQLSGLLGELSQAAGNVSSGASGAAQNAQLEGAIKGFLADWSQGLHDLQVRLDDLRIRLDGAGGAYQGTESEIAGHFGTG